MRKYLKHSLIFIVINLLVLYLGGLWTNPGVSSEWYNSLIKAPWNPPGWVFGAAWGTIAITFGISAAKFYKEEDHDMMLFYFISQVVNFLWGPLFFGFKSFLLSLIVIMDLSVIIFYMTHTMRLRHGWWVLYMLPYFIWLMIATSLNMFMLIAN
jgi:benzodiazapine receptor